MAADGKPERPTIRCGEEIRRLRKLRRWSRTKFLVQVWNEQKAGDPFYNRVTEAWIARLEDGRIVKVPRQTLEALCRALACTEQERVRVLLYADHNPLNTVDTEPSDIAEVLNYTLTVIHEEAKVMLSTLIGQRRASDLDEQEMLGIVHTALEMILKRRSR